jgi:hypothetical protein
MFAPGDIWASKPLSAPVLRSHPPPAYNTPFALSLSKGIANGTTGFDRLSPNGNSGLCPSR